MTELPTTTIVVPTVGRPSLRALLERLATGTRPVDTPVLVVDDRREGRPLDEDLRDLALPGLRVLRAGGGGPARSRNIGWRHARTPWVSFLDDDVLPAEDWYDALRHDLATAPPGVAGVAGHVTVPLPRHRRPTDWERGTAGLETAQWITADLSYRRSALAATGGFDERFRRAYREDADLGLRVTAGHGRIVHGTRRIEHPVRPADFWASLHQQRGNADDLLMRALHGPDWRDRAGAPRGRRTSHAAVTAAAAGGLVAALAGRRRTAAFSTLAWAVGTGRFAAERILPGPRDRDEVLRMLATSAAIPFAATWHSLRGAWQHRDAAAWRGLPELVLLDRDGTLVEDVPYNGDPEQVRPLPGAREALDRLRAVGIRVGVVSNQSGVGRGLLAEEQVRAVNHRVEQLLGPFDVWRWCPHGPDDGCDCRKPAPGMVKDACEQLGISPTRTVLVGDIGSDAEAAEAAGAVGWLVPTHVTRAEEVAAADRVARTLGNVVDDLLEGRW